MIPKKLIKLFLGIFFTIFFSFILLKNIDFNYFFQLFKKIDLLTISFAISFVFLDYFFRVQRWKFMLMSDNQKNYKCELIKPKINSIYKIYKCDIK